MDRMYSNTNCIVHNVFPVSEDKSTEVHLRGAVDSLEDAASFSTLISTTFMIRECKRQ